MMQDKQLSLSRGSFPTKWKIHGSTGKQASLREALWVIRFSF